MHIEQEEVSASENGDCSKEDRRTISKVSSVTHLLLPFSAISIAIREALIKPSQPIGGGEDDFEGDEKASRVIVKMFVVQPKSLQKCKAVFELGTSVPIGEGGSSSFSTINTTSDYEPANMIQAVATNHINLLTPDAFVSPAKTNTDNASQRHSVVASPITVSPLPPAPNEILVCCFFFLVKC